MNPFKHILLVEDDEAMNFLSISIFKDMGIGDRIGVTTDGEMAIDYIKKEGLPDIIFLDIRMPKMDGLEFLDIFSKQFDCCNTKIVVMTSSTRTEDQQKALSYNCVIDYMEKPLTEEIITYLSNQIPEESKLPR